MGTETRPFCILALDGGGAKGFYTLGVLREIEAMAGKPLCETFDLIFGAGPSVANRQRYVRLPMRFSAISDSRIYVRKLA